MIVETHPEEYNGYSFITLIQFNEKHLLTIIDNCDKKTIKAYVLDFCEVANVDEIEIINVANEWWNSKNPPYPVSIEFAKKGLTSEASKIYRSYAVDSVSRVIGPIPSFDMDNIQKIRRKRRVSPSNIITFRAT
jgi:hypothetical protein